MILKATLIALAALTAVDAAAWHGHYRYQVVSGCKRMVSAVADQDWSSGPLA